MTRDEIEARIEQYMVGTTHCARDRNLMRRKLLDGLTFEELAEEFGMSVRQTKTIIKKWKSVIT
jgi:AraC-like DNA-binding protein